MRLNENDYASRSRVALNLPYSKSALGDYQTSEKKDTSKIRELLYGESEHKIVSAN